MLVDKRMLAVNLPLWQAAMDKTISTFIKTDLNPTLQKIIIFSVSNLVSPLGDLFLPSCSDTLFNTTTASHRYSFSWFRYLVSAITNKIYQYSYYTPKSWYQSILKLPIDISFFSTWARKTDLILPPSLLCLRPLATSSWMSWLIEQTFSSRLLLQGSA